MNPIHKPGRKILHARQSQKIESGKAIGVTVCFRPGDQPHAEQILADLRTLGIAHVRTPLSWAECQPPSECAWYDWLIPTIARQAELLPCLAYTPGSADSDVHGLGKYRDFLELIVARFSNHFDWLELSVDLDGRSGPEELTDTAWEGLRQAFIDTAAWIKRQGKKTIFAVAAHCASRAFARVYSPDLLRHSDAIGVCDSGAMIRDRLHGDSCAAQLHTLLKEQESSPEVWITDTGFSLPRYNDHQQLRTLLDIVDAPAERIYWRATPPHVDSGETAPHAPCVEGHACHTGLRRSDGAPTLLFRLLQDGGVEKIRSTLRLAARPASMRATPDLVLITGGAGFIGTNLADRLLTKGVPVLIYDNLARPGAERNLHWLFDRHRDGLEFEFADVRDCRMLRRALHRTAQVLHLAAQPALGTSLRHPIEDYEVNSCGTLSLLEELRLQAHRPPLIFTSSSKVYGTLSTIRLKKEHTRYEPEDRAVRHNGIGEEQALEFSSPFACSKGGAEQYVLNYAKSYGLPAMALRVGTVYGTHQSGDQEHDWIAYLLRRTLQEQPITIYGDGLQVRDVLHVDDLVDAILLAQQHMTKGAGQVFNVGGGPGNTVSLRELIDLIEIVHGHAPLVCYQDWRPDDQRYYVSNISKFTAMTGWIPRMDVGDGIRRLYAWITERAAPQANKPLGQMALR